MNLEKAKVLLEKVNALMKSMEMAPDQVATIEKDLMKNYLRELYEVFQAPSTKYENPVQIAKKVERLDPGPKPAPKPEVNFEIEDPPGRPEEKQEAPKPPKQMEEETEKPSAGPHQEAKESPKAERPSFTYTDPELEEIFQIQNAKELSEKLSQMPITDLTKAFGLNEKIFTINELFGGDAALFTNVVKKLNRMDNFDEAKNYLIDEVAQKEEWSAPDKRKKAIEFIKIVKRRYN